MPRMNAIAAAMIHGVVPAVMLPLSRVTSARSDWLPAQPVKPVRFPSLKTMPCSHHLAESPGRITNPMSTVTRKPATVMAASRNFLVTSR